MSRFDTTPDRVRLHGHVLNYREFPYNTYDEYRPDCHRFIVAIVQTVIDLLSQVQIVIGLLSVILDNKPMTIKMTTLESVVTVGI